MDKGTPDNIPSLDFFRKRHSRIRRARGRQCNGSHVRDFSEPMINATSRTPVQYNQPDGWVRLDKARDFIRYRGPDPAIRTARAGTGSNNIPERDPFPREALAAFRIGKRCRDCEEFLHDRPEPVPRVPVVFAAFKREHAGKTAQDKDAGPGAGHRGESAGAVRDLLKRTGHREKIRYP